MNEEKAVSDRELEKTAGGVAGERSFAAVAEDFARTNRCGACPMSRRWVRHGMCAEEYGRLLMDWSGGGPVDSRCARRT